MSRSLNGTSHYLSALTGDPGPTHTVTCWFKTSSVAATVRTPVATGDPGTFGHYNNLELSNTSVFVTSRVAGANAGTAGNGPYSASTWTFAAMRLNSIASRQCIRGTTVGAANTGSRDPNITRVTIGQRGDQGGNFYGGLIAQVALFDYAVSNADLALLAGGDNPLALATPPINYWPLIGTSDLADVGAGADNMSNTGSTGSTDDPTVDPPPVASRLKRWNGSAWVQANIKRYNGSIWVPASVKKF